METISEYSFLKVLGDDKFMFISSLTNIEIDEININKKITLSKWDEVMRRCKFNTSYVLYRRCFYREGCYGEITSKVLSNKILPIKYYNYRVGNKPIEIVWCSSGYMDIVDNNKKLEKKGFIGNTYPLDYDIYIFVRNIISLIYKGYQQQCVVKLYFYTLFTFLNQMYFFKIFVKNKNQIFCYYILSKEKLVHFYL